MNSFYCRLTFFVHVNGVCVYCAMPRGSVRVYNMEKTGGLTSSYGLQWRKELNWRFEGWKVDGWPTLPVSPDIAA